MKNTSNLIIQFGCLTNYG